MTPGQAVQAANDIIETANKAEVESARTGEGWDAIAMKRGLSISDCVHIVRQLQQIHAGAVAVLREYPGGGDDGEWARRRNALVSCYADTNLNLPRLT